VQKETAPEQVPFVHRFEQHWLAVVQPLPAVRQVPPGLTGAHLLAVQIPLQHSLPVLHEAATGLSGLHATLAHWLFEPQKPEQHCAPPVHAAPIAPQVLPPPVPQTFGAEAPQMAPPGHGPAPTPHVRRPPQPSGTDPQLRPAHP
jgi:hypothetical protein